MNIDKLNKVDLEELQDKKDYQEAMSVIHGEDYKTVSAETIRAMVFD
ncbi:hypothetical protein G6R29_00885 [Fructobacillus sp. M2-14]|uniref:Uncharacterized protein n=1 Tax=Fructobacillus broussonetiae TaxID=2713173 RepID=A0ABS5QYA7_9LACO|nr:hypothetical protein [Fructobacillus broussonetiae]MBS9338188.1 hypothetical protein [Fructobacillus broussonetiae]